MKYAPILIHLVLVASLLAPSATVHAASAKYQALIDRAMAQYSEEGPRLDVTSIDVYRADFNKKKQLVDDGNFFKLNVKSNVSTYPRNITQLDDATGSLSIGEVTYRFNNDEGAFIDPLSLDVKIINNTLYIRVNKLSDEIIQKLNEEDGDAYTDERIRRAIGQWVMKDLTELVPFLKTQEDGEQRAVTSGSELFALTKKLNAVKSPIIVRSARVQEFEGAQVVAARVKVNPQLFAVLRQQLEKEVKAKSNKERKEQISNIRRAYTEIQKQLAKFDATFFVRESDATLVGYSITLKVSEPRTKCNNVKSRCQTVNIGVRETTAVITASSQPIADTSLVPPDKVMSLEEFAKIFEKPVAE